MFRKLGKLVNNIRGDSVETDTYASDLEASGNPLEQTPENEMHEEIFEEVILKPVSTELQQVLIILTGIKYHSSHDFKEEYPLNFKVSEDEYYCIGSNINPAMRLMPQQFPANLFTGIYRDKALAYVDSTMPEINPHNYASVLWEMMNYVLDSSRPYPHNMAPVEVAALVLAEIVVIERNHNIPLSAVATLATLHCEYNIPTLMSHSLLVIFDILFENAEHTDIENGTVSAVLDDLLLVSTSMLGSHTINIDEAYSAIIDLVASNKSNLGLTPSEIHYVLAHVEKHLGLDGVSKSFTSQLNTLKHILEKKSPCVSMVNLKL